MAWNKKKRFVNGCLGAGLLQWFFMEFMEFNQFRNLERILHVPLRLEAQEKRQISLT